MEAKELCLEIPGVELASGFYRDFGRPALLSRFEPYMDRMTIGLVGEGSECFGFDDRLSMDHDYGPSFCIWLSRDLYEEIGPAVAQVYDSLPRDYKNVSFGLRREQAEGRRGVIPTLPFYQKFLGNKVPPESALQWLAIPESYLAVATNGVLFHSPDTEFVRIRKQLLDFYPEDVCKKKLAANLVKMAHAGQVNYERMAKREDPVAARLALDQFIEAAIRESEPDVIITHHPADTNNDHLQTSMACQEAIRLFQRRPEVKRVKEFWYMEVPSCTEWKINNAMVRFNPNCFVEVGKEGVDAKIQALSMYRGVMRPYPHPRSAEYITGLAAMRGGQWGMVYAEAFEVVLREY